MIIKELFEGPVGDYCTARNTIKCLFFFELAHSGIFFLRLDRLAAFKIKFADDTRNGIVKRTNLVFGIDQSSIKLRESKTENQSR